MGERPYEPSVIEQRIRTRIEMGDSERALQDISILEDIGWTTAWLLRAQALASSAPQLSAEVLIDALANVEGPTEIADIERALEKGGHCKLRGW